MPGEAIIEEVLRREGGFVDHPDDLGGPTNRGITQRVLGAYRGRTASVDDVRALTVDEAREIYRRRYVVDPGFHFVANLNAAVANELIDTGVNMGVDAAGRFLQRALNALNVRGELYPDLVVDGRVGSATRAALRTYLLKRREAVLIKALNALQGARYIELCEQREKNETFVYGWLDQRV